MQLCCQTTWSAVIFSGRQMACSGRVRPTETRAHVAVRNPALGPPPKCIELPSAPRGLCARAVTEQFASWGRQGHKVSGATTVPKLSTRWHRAASRPPRPLRLAASQNVSRVAMLSANKDFDVVRSREHAVGRHAHTSRLASLPKSPCRQMKIATCPNNLSSQHHLPTLLQDVVTIAEQTHAAPQGSIILRRHWLALTLVTSSQTVRALL